DAAMIYAIANCYLEKPVTMLSAFSRALKVLLPLIGTWILTYLVVGLGFMLLIVPGIIFALWFSLASRVVVIEGIFGTGGMGRSKRLMKGNMGTAFVLGFLVAVIGAMIGWAPRLIPQAEVQVLVSTVLQAILSIFAAAVWVVLYFSCRCKAENFDLTMLADSVAAKDAPAVL